MSSSGPHAVFTIGHSTHSFEVFAALLRQHGVTAVADVRSAPFSRFNPQFNREPLSEALKARGIRYIFIGQELGARSNDPSCYEKGRVQYNRLARTNAFRNGIERVIRGADKHSIALMCAEKEPLQCHRTLLVARALAERGISVNHILADGSLETHEATMERLFDVVGVPHQDLFRSKAELLAEALTRQEQRVAFVDDSLTTESEGEPE